MLNLGELIVALERSPQDKPVYFDELGLVPTKLDSYRGYYDHLALGFSDDASAPKVSELLATCKSAVGRTFSGWKGGDYKMDERTTLWVANPGKTTGYQIERVLWSEDNWRVVLAIKRADGE